MPGCRPPPGTSRFKFPKNKKKKKLWLNSLKIDETNEIGDSRVCSLHFKPNLITSAKLSEFSPARNFFLSRHYQFFCENPVFPKNKAPKYGSEQTRSSHDKKFEAKGSIYFLIND